MPVDLPTLPSPLAAADFLRWMRTDTPGLYLLGSLNRHITVHSQQRRAINLIAALMAQAPGLDGKSIAIVGAGFAGLTAAAYALENTTADVALFDAAPRPIWIQDACANRWLHPGIYDWPLPGSLEPRTSLPVLNWRAAAAGEVAAQVRSEWDRIAATKARLRLQLETKVTAVRPAPGDRLSLDLDDGGKPAFDVVVLAVGFGLEGGDGARVGYWNDADGLDGLVPDSSVLVCGFGDGGLADVLRLCLPDIRQDSLIDLVRLVPTEWRGRLVEWEERYRTDSASLDKLFGELRVEPIVRRIEEAAPALANVTLVGKGHLYGSRSAILNRFLISQLRQARGEGAFRLINDAVDESSLVGKPGGKRRIGFATGPVEEFDRVVLRLGPLPVYRSVAPLGTWPVGDERRRHWYDMPQSLDQTRVPLWGGAQQPVVAEVERPEFLAYASSSDRWCAVLQSHDSKINWALHVRHALEGVKPGAGRLNTEPLLLYADDATVDSSALAVAVRTLCAADIVVADVTDYDPAVMLLLGIRASVRRSVTVACTGRPLGQKLWASLPFNLKELNLVSFGDQAAGNAELVAALGEGLAQSRASARYLDLPVYDYVREDSADRKRNDDVLLLRAFSSYGDDRKLHVEKRIHAALGMLPTAHVEALIDQTSPRLAGQRLYEAIRHWRICVVDLTLWRPNVLFELGVRLAVRESSTYCLLDPAQETHKAGLRPRVQLTKLLKPFSYGLDTSAKGFARAFDKPVGPLVYAAAARHFLTAQDSYSTEVDELLLQAAALTTEPEDPLQDVDVTPLFGRDNHVYGDEIRHAVFERLCAAWCYLADRNEPHSLRAIDLLDRRRAGILRRFRQLGSRLKAGLAHRHSARDLRLRQRIDETDRLIKSSGAAQMSELLDAWEKMRTRATPPWNTDPDGFAGDPSLIEDCSFDLEQLVQLEHRLMSLANPACELPLQGVRSDRSRLEAVLQRVHGSSS